MSSYTQEIRLQAVITGGTATKVDYKMIEPRMFIVPPQDYTTPRTILLHDFNVRDDNDTEGDETLIFEIQSLNTDIIAVGDASSGGGTQSSYTYTIQNDD